MGQEMYIEFVKMHGLGNDFVMVQKTQEIASMDLHQLAIDISDRRLGIGCDQFILYHELEGNVFEMFIYNQDGSTASACGNGTRCLAKLIGRTSVTIKVGERELACRLFDNDMVSVDMGKASFNESWMPEDAKLWEIASRYKIDPREILCIDVGNPHLVIFKPDLTEQDQELLGKTLEQHKIFDRGINVNFAVCNKQVIDLKVWERGDGFTLACGSGACATFAAARKLGFVGDEAVVRFKLGDLRISYPLTMTGPATEVARGIYTH